MYEDFKFRGAVNFLSESSKRSGQQPEKLPKCPIVFSEMLRIFAQQKDCSPPCPATLFHAYECRHSALHHERCILQKLHSINHSPENLIHINKISDETGEAEAWATMAPPAFQLLKGPSEVSKEGKFCII